MVTSRRREFIEKSTKHKPEAGFYIPLTFNKL